MGRKKWKEGGLRDGMERGRERKWRPKRLGMCVSCRKFFSTFHARTHNHVTRAEDGGDCRRAQQSRWERMRDCVVSQSLSVILKAVAP